MWNLHISITSPPKFNIARKLFQKAFKEESWTNNVFTKKQPDIFRWNLWANSTSTMKIDFTLYHRHIHIHNDTTNQAKIQHQRFFWPFWETCAKMALTCWLGLSAKNKQNSDPDNGAVFEDGTVFQELDGEALK